MKVNNIYSTSNRSLLVLELAEALKDLTNWGKYDSPDEWEKRITAFDRLTQIIPTKYLETCVMYAAQNHRREKDFNPAQVTEAWSHISEVIAREEAGGHAERQKILGCVDCRGTGFVKRQKEVDGQIVSCAERCKNKCKGTTNLSREREPMPDEVKQMLRGMRLGRVS
ncbi:MAG: hypothetical protein WAQ98_11180 [Blastocatellia bacterium]